MDSKVIAGELERIFGKKAQVLRNKIKIHIPTLNGAEIVLISKLYFLQGVSDLKIKRSGGGVTVIIKVNSSERV